MQKIDDSISLNVPPISLSNVPPVSLLNVSPFINQEPVFKGSLLHGC